MHRIRPPFEGIRQRPRGAWNEIQRPWVTMTVTRARDGCDQRRLPAAGACDVDTVACERKSAPVLRPGEIPAIRDDANLARRDVSNT